MKLLRNGLFLGLILVIGICIFSPVIHAADPTPTPCIATDPTGQQSPCVIVDQQTIGFRIPSFSEILSFAIRLVFIGGGLAALAMLLLGAVSWILSGGDKDKISAAQQKIQAAIIGVIMIAVVLAIIVTLEQVIFARRICLGISCPITIPSLLKSPGDRQPQNGAVIEELNSDITTETPAVVTVTPSPTPLILVTPSLTNHPYNLESTPSSPEVTVTPIESLPGTGITR